MTEDSATRRADDPDQAAARVALADLAARYWDAQLAASPLTASLLGDHRFDDRIDDLSEAADDSRGSPPSSVHSTSRRWTRRVA